VWITVTSLEKYKMAMLARNALEEYAITTSQFNKKKLLGACAIGSRALAELFQEAGVPAHVCLGYYDDKRFGMLNHCWTVCEDEIWDLTAISPLLIMHTWETPTKLGITYNTIGIIEFVLTMIIFCSIL
jgi:hypothetical protein